MVPPVLFYQDIREKKIFTFLFTLIQNEETGTGSRGVLPRGSTKAPALIYQSFPLKTPVSLGGGMKAAFVFFG